MSRIGKKPVVLPDGVRVTVIGAVVTVESGSNRLSLTHRPEVSVEVDEAAKQIKVDRKSDDRNAKAMHGLTRSLLNNMVEGVTKGFSKELEISGVGWTAKLEQNKLNLSVGYADTRVVDVADGLTVEIRGARIKVSGADKQAVGQLAAQIRAQRPPEPYNAKGIKYVDEQIVRKQGKAIVGGTV